MSIRVLFAALVLFFCVVSCSDTSTPPTDNNGNGNGEGAIDSTGFAIIGAATDTLYSGEAAWIMVNELGTDVEKLRLFVHTVEVEQMEILGNRLLFTVPRNSQTGKLRLYKNDTLLAKNNFSLHVLPRNIRDFNITFGGIIPPEGYPGEIINLYVSDFPLRRRDFDFWLGDSLLKVVEWNSNPVRLIVPEGKGKSTLKVRLFENIRNIQEFEILSHEGGFLQDFTVGQFMLNAYLLGDMKLDVTSPDSSYSMLYELVNAQVGSILFEQATIMRSDSIYIKAHSAISDQEAAVDIALIPAVDRNTVSGRITVSYRYSIGLPTETYQTVTAIVEDMLWKRLPTGYVIYERGEAVKEKLRSISSLLTWGGDHGEAYHMRITNYTGADINSDFKLILGP